MKVVHKYDVPYGAGTSKDGKTVYIDHRVPKELDVNGKKMNVVKALVAHETAEKKAMDKGIKYQKAHDLFAVPAENKQVRSQGVDPKKYNKKLDKTLDKVVKKIDAPEPPDLEPKPYKDTKKMSLLKNLIHKNHGSRKT